MHGCFLCLFFVICLFVLCFAYVCAFFDRFCLFIAFLFCFLGLMCRTDDPSNQKHPRNEKSTNTKIITYHENRSFIQKHKTPENTIAQPKKKHTHKKNTKIDIVLSHIIMLQYEYTILF